MLSRIFVAVLGLSFLCAPAALGGPDGAKKGEKKHGVRGVVESVQKDKDKDTGSILINVRAKKKAAPAEGDRDRKFYVTEDTKFEKLIFAGMPLLARPANAFGELLRAPGASKQ
ncbi:MAG: hypothetical protein E6K70_15945 [Planctomycetota bacterium]|nr:MAG: hypothetical protein E6K70_15945 [Planctomycetota bacterium]